MGRKTLIGIGVGIILVGGIGVFNAISDLDAASPVGDQTTTGKITSLATPTNRLSKGVQAAPSFAFMYAFRTDGKLFFGEQAVDKSAFESLTQGDQVTVHFESGNPRVSAAETVAGDSSATTDLKTRLKVCSGTIVFGLVITVLACFCKDEKRPSPGQTPKKFSEDPIAALRRWRSGWQIGPAATC